jgi:pimeloyl-ACP methyl ester carboxylesterase
MGEAIQCEYTVRGEGPPLFLIHGIGAARDAWRFIVPHLESTFTCITYDLRGHGESPLPSMAEGEFGLDDLVTDLEALRHRLGIDQAHFAGHSLGGMIGPAYARKHPHRVLTLGLLSTAAGRTAEDRGKLSAVESALVGKGIAEALPTFVDRWFTDRFIEERRDLVERRLKQVIDTNADIFMNVFRIYAGTEMGPWLKEITSPSLVLTGELDGGCNPRLNRFIADHLPSSELVILEGYKHAILVEAPGQVAEHLRRFCAGPRTSSIPGLA